jgi:hypothetical protein
MVWSTNNPWCVPFYRAGFAGVHVGILGGDPARQVHVQGQEALETVADWTLLDWGLVACAAADELVPEIQALEAQRTLHRLRPILEARGSTC